MKDKSLVILSSVLFLLPPLISAIVILFSDQDADEYWFNEYYVFVSYNNSINQSILSWVRVLIFPLFWVPHAYIEIRRLSTIPPKQYTSHMWYTIEEPRNASRSKAIAQLLAGGAIPQAIGSILPSLEAVLFFFFVSSIVFIVTAGVAVANVYSYCSHGGEGSNTRSARMDQVGTLGFLAGTIMLLLGLLDFTLYDLQNLGPPTFRAFVFLWTLTGFIFLLTDITRVYNTDNVVTERELQQEQNRYPGNDADNVVVIAQPVHSSGVSVMIVEEV